jgi:hypothetical protein
LIKKRGSGGGSLTAITDMYEEVKEFLVDLVDDTPYEIFPVVIP